MGASNQAMQNARPAAVVTYIQQGNAALQQLSALPHPCLVAVFSMDGQGAAYISSSGVSLLPAPARQACLAALAAYMHEPHE